MTSRTNEVDVPTNPTRWPEAVGPPPKLAESMVKPDARGGGDPSAPPVFGPMSRLESAWRSIGLGVPNVLGSPDARLESV